MIEEENTIDPYSENLVENFFSAAKANEEYLKSDEVIEDAQREVEIEKLAPIAARETAKIANDDDTGIFGSVLNFGKHIGIGAAKGIEETGQTLRLIDDNAWNLPTPKTTAENLAQGFGQFLPLFIPFNIAIGGGLKAANILTKASSIFTKSKRLTKAGELMSASAAGAISDFTAFDPKDPNVANFLLATGAVSNDSMAGSALKTYLAQDDSDPELKARLKAATSGVIAGAIVDQLVRGVGGLYRKAKGVKGKVIPKTADNVPLKEIKETAKKTADEYLDGVDKVKQEASPEQLDTITKDLPDIKPAVKEKFKKEQTGYIRPWERLSSDKQDDVMDIIHRWGRGEKVEDLDLSVIESMNFTKIPDKEIANLMQFISIRADVKEFVKGKPIPTEAFDTMSGLADLANIPEEQLSRVIEEKALDVRGGIKFIGVSRAFGAGMEALSLKSSQSYGATGLKVHEDAMYRYQKLAYDFMASGGELSKAYSDGLRAHQKLVPTEENKSAVNFIALNAAVKQPPEISIIQAGRNVVKKNIDDLVIKTQFHGGAAKKFTKKSTEQLIKAKIKRLEKQLRSEKAPERGKPGHPVTSPKIRELQEKIKQVKFDRATLREKVTPTKEQLAIRKEFERISKQILDAGKGITKTKKLKPVEITDLKAQLKRVTKEYKENLPEEAKVELRLQQLNNEYSKVLLTKKKDVKPKVKIEETPKELELKEAIRKHKERLGLIGKKELTREELLEMVTELATQSELEEIGKATLAQLKARLKAMNTGKVTRTKDAALEIYINGLLSSPKTFEINMLGNSTAIGASVIERSYAGFIKRGGDVSAQEAKELIKGYWETLGSFSELWKLAKQSWDLEPTVNIKQDLIRPHDRNISAETWRQGGLLGQAINVLGSVVNIPGKMLLRADEIFKAINYRAEVRALAYRKAYTEVGLDGATVSDKSAITKRFAEIMQDIGEHKDIAEQATGFAAKNTYTNKLASHPVKDKVTGKIRPDVPGLALRLKGMLDADPTGMARVFVPFFQTPANLLGFAWDRTPILRRWNKTLQRELSPEAPKAVRELAEAKVATSRIMWGGLLLYAFNGNVTGAPPRDPNLRKTLEQAMGGPNWYSRNSGDGWKKYDRFDPLGVMLGGAANMAIIAKASMNLAGYNKEEDLSGELYEKYLDMLNAGTAGTVRLLSDRHYLQGFSEMINIISGEGSLGYKARKTGEKVYTAFNPMTSFYSSFRRNLTTGIYPEKAEKLQGTDLESLGDFGKELGNIFEETLRSVTPGYGDRKAVKNLAGETVLFPGTNHEFDTQPFQVISNMMNVMFNPNPPLSPSKSPLIHKLAELEMTIGQPSGINKVNGITLNDEEKSFFIDRWTDLNKALIEPLVSAKNFNKIPEGIQRTILKGLIKEHKKKAKKATMETFRRLLVGSATNTIRGEHSKILKEVPTGFQTNNLFSLQPQGPK